MGERALTIRQPWADLTMAGVKPVENRSWPVPSTVADVDPDEPPLWECPYYRKQIGCADPGMGDYGEATCSFGCYDEPVCVTGGPLPFPVRLWIHAAASVEPRRSPLWRRGGIPHDYLGIGLEWARWASAFAPHARRSSPLADRLGVLLGSVLLTGCHHADDCRDVADGWGGGGWTSGFVYCSRWAEPDRWHWTIADPKPLDQPIPMRGRQGLWRVEVPARA